MITIIGVRFRNAGKIYYFDPGEEQISRGMSVIVETARGMEMGTVMVGNKEVEEDSVVQPLKPVIRVATQEDFDVVRKNKEKEKEAYRICREKIAKHELDMKLVDVEYTFDNNKILFYFTADGRIDFRELVKDLASVFRTRIELRQIGVRDETKILGGIGICGRSLCCHSYMSEFIPVSIRMAKEQNLSLNPTKISGVCGRLMCCLKNEEETYEYLNSRLPSVGDTVTAKSDGARGEVQSVNVLRQLVKVKVLLNAENHEVEVREYPTDDLKVTARRRKDGKMKPEAASADDLENLESLEKEERQAGRSSKNSRRRQGNRRNQEESKRETDAKRETEPKRETDTKRERPQGRSGQKHPRRERNPKAKNESRQGDASGEGSQQAESRRGDGRQTEKRPAENRRGDGRPNGGRRSGDSGTAPRKNAARDDPRQGTE